MDDGEVSVTSLYHPFFQTIGKHMKQNSTVTFSYFERLEMQHSNSSSLKTCSLSYI